MRTVFSSVGFFYSAVVTNSVLHTEVPSGTRWDREISVSMHTLHTRSSMIDRKFVSLGKPLEIGEHGGRSVLVQSGMLSAIALQSDAILHRDRKSTAIADVYIRPGFSVGMDRLSTVIHP